MWHPHRHESSGLSRGTVTSGRRDIGSGRALRITGYPEPISSNTGGLTGLQTAGSRRDRTGSVWPGTGAPKRAQASRRAVRTLVRQTEFGNYSASTVTRGSPNLGPGDVHPTSPGSGGLSPKSHISFAATSHYNVMAR